MPDLYGQPAAPAFSSALKEVPESPDFSALRERYEYTATPDLLHEKDGLKSPDLPPEDIPQAGPSSGVSPTNPPIGSPVFPPKGNPPFAPVYPSTTDLPVPPVPPPSQEDPAVSTMEDVNDSFDKFDLDKEAVFYYERVWPTKRKIFIPADELSWGLPGEAMVPPCTIRFRLPPRINTNRDKDADIVRGILMGQVQSTFGAEFAKVTKVSFPKQLGQRTNRFFSVDITVRSKTQYDMLDQARFSINKTKLEPIDFGPPVPANLVTVRINHVSSVEDQLEVGLLLAEKLGTHATVHDVFTTMARYKNIDEPQPTGRFLASVQFTQVDEATYPSALVREYFPGWIKIGETVCQLYFAGRLDHCQRCREKADKPHIGSMCPRNQCNGCREFGHIRSRCPRINHTPDDAINETETNTRNAANVNIRPSSRPVPPGTTPTSLNSQGVHPERLSLFSGANTQGPPPSETGDDLHRHKRRREEDDNAV
jgi:hypothetical protein